MQDNSSQHTEESSQEEEFKAKAGRLRDHVGDYVQTYIELAKVKAVKGASIATADIIIGITALFFLFFILFFVGFGLGWWLGNVLENRAAGFFAVAGIYLLFGVLIFALRKKLIVPAIQKMIISRVYE